MHAQLDVDEESGDYVIEIPNFSFPSRGAKPFGAPTQASDPLAAAKNTSVRSVPLGLSLPLLLPYRLYNTFAVDLFGSSAKDVQSSATKSKAQESPTKPRPWAVSKAINFTPRTLSRAASPRLSSAGSTGDNNPGKGLLVPSRKMSLFDQTRVSPSPFLSSVMTSEQVRKLSPSFSPSLDHKKKQKKVNEGPQRSENELLIVIDKEFLAAEELAQRVEGMNLPKAEAAAELLRQQQASLEAKAAAQRQQELVEEMDKIQQLDEERTRAQEQVSLAFSSPSLIIVQRLTIFVS